MSEAYESVVGGGLKLKGIQKKKKKAKREDAEHAAEAAAAAAAATTTTTAASSSSSTGPMHTDSERRRLETMQKRQVEKLEKGEVKSHRDRIKDFNSYLGNLTEHYDLPKVSKGN
uniref:Protein FAM32A n=1 Tax=Haptolina brevifila TaxID=156173 RepID=A0A7S2HBF6_9EUKA